MASECEGRPPRVGHIDPLGLFQAGSTGLDLGSPTSSSGPRSLAEVRALNDIFNFENTVGPVTPEKAALFAQLTEAFGNLVVGGTGASQVGNPAIGQTLEGMGRATIQLGRSTINAGRIAGPKASRLGQQGLTRALDTAQRGGFISGTIAGLGQSFTGIPVPDAPTNTPFNRGVAFGDAVGDDALSRLITTNRLNNATTTYAYEIDDDVASVSHLFTGGIRADFGYSYNAVHNRKFTSPSDSRFVFNFLAPVEANYANNNMNQATSVAFEPQGAGQGTTYALGYDLNDNLGSGLNPNSYTHDVENRLISATTPNDSITYTYDAFGTRTSKTVDGVVTKYILDGDQVIAEYDGSSKLLRRYVYAGLDQPIQMVTPSATYYYHADGLGSVIALSDAGANRVETYALGPYGQINQPSSRGNPYLYTGREYDGETGLYYYRNRYYDPELGRFLEPDPAGFSDGLNLYAYVGGNPTNFVDPLGLYGAAFRSGMQNKADQVFGFADTISGGTSTAFLSGVGNKFDQIDSGFGLLRPVGSPACGGGFTCGTVPQIFGPARVGGLRPLAGSRTFRGVVDDAVQRAGGNPTIVRNGQDLFRLRSSGHGSSSPSVTPLNIRNVNPKTGQAFVGQGRPRSVTPRDIRELFKAQDSTNPLSRVRTRGGR